MRLRLAALLLTLLLLTPIPGNAMTDPNFWSRDILAYHTYLQEMTPLEVEAVNDGEELATLPLIVPPGRYKVSGQTYDMTTEGLYRFFAMDSLNTLQRIVYQSDPIAIINGAQWLTTQSYVDQGLTYPQMTQKAKTDKLRLGCGYATLWTKSLLDGLGYTSRMVNGITSENWHYTTSDGHALLEVWLDGKWVVFDFSFNTRFWVAGTPASLMDVHYNLPDGYEIERMTVDTSYDVSGLQLNGKSLAALFEPLSNDDFLREYYARLFQIPLVYSDGSFYYFDPAKQVEFNGWGYIQLNEQEYLERFYRD